MDMKKRILAMLLSALLTVNISSCNFDYKSEIEKPVEDIETTGTIFEGIDDKTTGSEANAEAISTWKGPKFCNGVLGDSENTYTFNQHSEFSVHIADWNEDYLVTSLSGKDINAVKYSATAMGINNERAFLLLKRSNKITIVSFEKGSPSETVVTLDVDEEVCEISGNFINENIGYVFAFKEAEKAIHSRGSSKLSNLLKTEDGGNTWNAIDVQHVPLLDLRESIIFSKMISEDVGIIAGEYWGSDYNFCERTLLTTDGGLNWVNVNILELPQNDDLHWAVVTDFTLVDESYILTIRYETPEENYDDAKYKLIDQNTWVRIS